MKSRRTNGDTARIRKLLAKGMGTADIAIRLGVLPKRVAQVRWEDRKRAHCVSLGLTWRSIHGLPKELQQRRGRPPCGG